MNPQLVEGNKRKLVVVGDRATGKTDLLNAYYTRSYQAPFNPVPYKSYDVTIKADKQSLELELWDTFHEDWERLRPLSYPKTHVFLICFSIDSPESLENVEAKWVPELHHFCPYTPYILVGCKTDLRQDRQTLDKLDEIGLGVVSKEEGEAVARKIGAAMYLECSAKTDEGLAEVFNQAARISMSMRRRTNHYQCVIL